MTSCHPHSPGSAQYGKKKDKKKKGEKKQEEKEEEEEEEEEEVEEEWKEGRKIYVKKDKNKQA